MHVSCVAKGCYATAQHHVETSKTPPGGYNSCTLHLRDVIRIVTGYYGGRIRVSLMIDRTRASENAVSLATSRQRHSLAG